MQLTTTHKLSPAQKAAVVVLWNSEYPKQFKFSAPGELDSYLYGLSDPLHILFFNNEALLGWAFLFERDNEKWFAIIVDHTAQKTGLGTKLLNMLKAKEQRLNGWVIDHDTYKKDNGDVYPSPMQFYLKNDFVAVNETRLETDKLSAVKIIWQQ